MNPHWFRIAWLNVLLGLVSAGATALVWALSAPQWRSAAETGLLPVPMGVIHSIFGLLTAIGLLQAISGATLLRQPQRAAPLLRGISLLGLFAPPIGTAVSIYTLWTLSRHHTGPAGRVEAMPAEAWDEG